VRRGRKKRSAIFLQRKIAVKGRVGRTPHTRQSLLRAGRILQSRHRFVYNKAGTGILIRPVISIKRLHRKNLQHSPRIRIAVKRIIILLPLLPNPLIVSSHATASGSRPQKFDIGRSAPPDPPRAYTSRSAGVPKVYLRGRKRKQDNGKFGGTTCRKRETNEGPEDKRPI